MIKLLQLMTHAHSAVLCAHSDHWTRESGMTYDERYEAYSKEYKAYEKSCLENGTIPLPKCKHKSRVKGGFCGIPASMPVAKQLRKLEALKKSGDVRSSPTETLADPSRGLVAFSTDAVKLAEAKTMVCYQAAIVHATAASLDQLGESCTAPLDAFIDSPVPSVHRYCSSSIPEVAVRRGR